MPPPRPDRRCSLLAIFYFCVAPCLIVAAIFAFTSPPSLKEQLYLDNEARLLPDQRLAQRSAAPPPFRNLAKVSFADASVTLVIDTDDTVTGNPAEAIETVYITQSPGAPLVDPDQIDTSTQTVNAVSTAVSPPSQDTATSPPDVASGSHGKAVTTEATSAWTTCYDDDCYTLTETITATFAANELAAEPTTRSNLQNTTPVFAAGEDMVPLTSNTTKTANDSRPSLQSLPSSFGEGQAVTSTGSTPLPHGSNSPSDGGLDGPKDGNAAISFSPPSPGTGTDFLGTATGPASQAIESVTPWIFEGPDNSLDFMLDNMHNTATGQKVFSDGQKLNIIAVLGQMRNQIPAVNGDTESCIPLPDDPCVRVSDVVDSELINRWWANAGGKGEDSVEDKHDGDNSKMENNDTGSENEDDREVNATGPAGADSSDGDDGDDGDDGEGADSSPCGSGLKKAATGLLGTLGNITPMTQALNPFSECGMQNPLGTDLTGAAALAASRLSQEAKDGLNRFDDLQRQLGRQGSQINGLMLAQGNSVAVTPVAGAAAAPVAAGAVGAVPPPYQPPPNQPLPGQPLNQPAPAGQPIQPSIQPPSEPPTATNPGAPTVTVTGKPLAATPSGRPTISGLPSPSGMSSKAWDSASTDSISTVLVEKTTLVTSKLTDTTLKQSTRSLDKSAGTTNLTLTQSVPKLLIGSLPPDSISTSTVAGKVATASSALNICLRALGEDPENCEPAGQDDVVCSGAPGEDSEICGTPGEDVEGPDGLTARSVLCDFNLPEAQRSPDCNPSPEIDTSEERDTECHEAAELAKKGKFKKFFSKILRRKDGFKKKYEESKAANAALIKELEVVKRERDGLKTGTSTAALFKEYEACKKKLRAFEKGKAPQAQPCDCVNQDVEAMRARKDRWKAEAQALEEDCWNQELDLKQWEQDVQWREDDVQWREDDVQWRAEDARRREQALEELRKNTKVTEGPETGTGSTYASIIAAERANTEQCQKDLNAEIEKRRAVEKLLKGINQCSHPPEVSRQLRECAEERDQLKKVRGCLEDESTKGKRQLEEENRNLQEDLREVSDAWGQCQDELYKVQEEAARAAEKYLLTHWADHQQCGRAYCKARSETRTHQEAMLRLEAQVRAFANDARCLL